MRISDLERRRRLARRHLLTESGRDVVGVVKAVAALHSTDPITPYLATQARVPGFKVEQMDRSLFEDRTLWRLHAMRRTLFIVPTRDAAVFLAGASRAVAERERSRLTGWLSQVMGEDEIPGWVERVSGRVIEILEAKGELRTQDLTKEIPEMSLQIRVGSGKWATATPVSSRLLFLLAMEGRVVRTRPAGSWRSSQYRWAAGSAWFGDPPRPMPEPEARSVLLSRYLETHGPATLTDIRWWTGWTARSTRAALADSGAVPVDLDSEEEGFVLADDAEPTDEPEPTVSFLPGLDPTPMGWKQRDWYLGPHADSLFDRNGNVGPTVWANGRIVGGWAQRGDGTVVYRLLEEVDRPTADLAKERARALTEWLDGEVVSIRFRSPLERELSER